MDHMKVLKRAWQILWSYKALWIFGIILALTAGTNNGNNGNNGIQLSGMPRGSSQSLPFTPPANIQAEIESLIRAAGRFFQNVGAARIVGWVIAAVIAFVCVIFLLSIIGVIARLVSQVALFKMVNQHEETGERVTVGEGFRLGWSRHVWRVFLINLVVVVPLIVAFVLIFLVALSPLFLWAFRTNAVGIFGTILSIGLIFLAVVVLIVVVIAARLLLRFARRACALEDLGVTASIGRGYKVVRDHFKDVGLMWLIMLGVNIAFLVVMIPVFIIVLIAAALAGGVVLLTVRGITGLFTRVAVAWIAGAIVAAPVFLTVFGVPVLFIGGLFQVYQSTVWTLTYREVTALDVPVVEGAPVPEPTPIEGEPATAAEEEDDQTEAAEA